MPEAADTLESDFDFEEDRPVRGGARWAAWLLWLVALLLLLAILAYVLRGPLSNAVPRIAPWLDRYVATVDTTAQGLVGRTTGRASLSLQDIRYDVKEYDGEKEILVAADLVNTGRWDLPAPKVRVRIVDADREPIKAVVIDPLDGAETIPAGESARYFVRISEPPAVFDSVLLNIADGQE